MGLFGGILSSLFNPIKELEAALQQASSLQSAQQAFNSPFFSSNFDDTSVAMGIGANNGVSAFSAQDLNATLTAPPSPPLSVAAAEFSGVTAKIAATNPPVSAPSSTNGVTTT
jgi:hypothetical protein